MFSFVGFLSKYFNFLPVLIVGIVLASNGAKTQTLPITKNLINFNSTLGEKLLLDSQAKQDYFPLSIQFLTQSHPAYCGVASIVMVLNALSISAPEVPGFGNYRFFTQDNLFNNPKTQQVMTSDAVAKGGMTLEQLGKLLESYPVKVSVYYGSDVSLEVFRQLLIDNLQDSNNFVLVNYLRTTIGQERGGHISPLAAYNKETDRFLILDVSRYKYPPVWVTAEELWQATRTVDSASSKTRGFVLVSLF